MMEEYRRNNKKNKGKEVMQSSHHPSRRTSSAAAKEYTYDVFLSCSVYESFYIELLNTFKTAGLDVAVGRDPFDASDQSRLNPMEAIEQSKLCIPVFDPYHAYRKSFLDEVAKMNECRSTTGQIVLPIFCDIKPSDVQNQTGPFKAPFRRYQNQGVHSQVVIDKWKLALTEIGSLEGYQVMGSESAYAEHAEKIVDQAIELVLGEVLDNNLVGIRQSYGSIAEMLRIGSKIGVRIVGICGMAGIGKTALAKFVYKIFHPCFDRCSFVSGIQERSGKNGLHSLQVQLINDLLENTNDVVFGSFEDSIQFIEDSIQFIKDRFSNTRVLMVLDGVEYLDHIKAFGVDPKCFGPGSMIILTTRKPELLIEAEVPYRYFVEELDEPHALELFYKHAFKDEFPLEEYDHLSTQIASCTRGIPSVIKSAGSYLSNYRNDKDRWEEVLRQLRNEEYEPLRQSLMLSNDKLSKGRWHFYHDKACFPMGESNDIVHYDVVLSFDARDRVKNVVESLHKRMESFGIGIFALNGESKQVNVTGKIFIPVLSKSYSSNSSCLEMLVHMVECRRSSATNHILPIFCAMEPSDIRLQTPLYESYLCADGEAMNRWKGALTEVANISGCSLPNAFTREEIHNLLDSVSQMVLHKLKLNQLSMGNHLVGINHHVERILELLNLDVNDVRIVAVTGENGTGKTTLSKIVYQQLASSFEGCSFLSDIDERTLGNDGIKYLQAKMISDLLNRKYGVLQSVIEEADVIERRFRHMKVLIILDDVTNTSHVEALVGQLDWFGIGSRIIIATQNPAIIPLPHLNYPIMTNWKTEPDNAYKLFSRHTFRKDEPLPNFKTLSQEIVHLLDRVAYPLVAIEIVGSLLCGKGEAEWKSLLRNLRPVWGNAFEHILRICYDRLDSTQQKVFLDISCLPSGIDRQIASYLWYDSLQSSDLDDMQALILLMLLKVDSSNGIWMHRLVRDFGREIVRGGSQEVSRKGKDFGGEIVHGESQTVSRKGKDFGREIVRGVSQKVSRKFKDFGREIVRGTSQKLSRKNKDSGRDILRGMSQKVSRKVKDFSREILCGMSQNVSRRGETMSVFSEFSAQNFERMDQMEASKLDDAISIEIEDEIEEYTVSYSPKQSTVTGENMGVSPKLPAQKFERMDIMETFELDDAISIENDDHTVIYSPEQSTVTGENMGVLPELPAQKFERMDIVETFEQDGTTSIESEDHSEVDLCENKVVLSELPPKRFEGMDKMKTSELDRISVESKDHIISSESEDCAIMRQRDLIWQQCSGDSPTTFYSECLKVLDMSWSRITEGWEGWKQLKVPQLRVLNLSGCSNLMVTPVFSFCPHLKMLILEHCPRLVKIDPSIGELQCLSTLKLRYCRELSVLPKEVGCLTALTELLLDGTSLRELPVSIGHLKELNLFTAINCFSLSYLPSATLNLFSLTAIKLDYASIRELPRTIGRKMKLQYLSLRGCHGITRLPSLVGEVESSLVELDVSKTSISELPKSITNLKALRVLKIEYCFITELPPHFGELRRLEEIHASRCRNLETLPDDVGELESLRILDIRESCISSLPQSIDALAHLETLDCTSCNKLQTLPKLPSSLTSVRVESKELNKLPNLVNLKQLKELTLGGDEIVNLRALSNFSTVATPDIEEDDSFGWLPQSSLRTLRLSLPLVENLPAGFPDSLRKLSLHCTKLKHIPPLPSTLVVLSIQDCRSLGEMPSLENLENLQEMEILDCPEIKKIESLESLRALRVLTISSSGIVSLKGLENLRALNRLTLLDCGALSDELSYLSTLTGVAVNISS